MESNPNTKDTKDSKVKSLTFVSEELESKTARENPSETHASRSRKVGD